MYPIIEVPPEVPNTVEQLGTKGKFWFVHNELGRCLCKLGRPETGEDWSEKVAAEIADVLDIPHAQYELGSWKGQPCVVSRKFVESAEILVHGNEVIRRVDPGYDEALNPFHQSEHTVDAVFDALTRHGCSPPREYKPSPAISSSTAVFVGYLMLDALVGNTDRHHENWGIIESPKPPVRLAHRSTTPPPSGVT